LHNTLKLRRHAYEDLNILSPIFLIPTDIHPTSPLIHKDRERVSQVDKRTDNVGDFMYSETDTLMPALGKFYLVLNEPAGTTFTFCKPTIQVFDSQQVPHPAEGASHHQGIHRVSMGLKARGCQQSYGICFNWNVD
jgi:hypothetical protein